MYFIAKTPLGEFRSVFSDDETSNNTLKKMLTVEISNLEYIYFESEYDEGGTVKVSLPRETIQNSVFIIVE